MRIFDFHIHPGSDDTTNTIVDYLDQINAECGAVLATDHGKWGVEHGTQISNERVAELVTNSSGRLYGIASISPDSDDNPADKMEKAIELGLKGLKIYPHSGFYANDKRMFGSYEVAQKYGIPLMVHAGMKAHRSQNMIFNNPIYIDDIAVNFPRLPIVIMHAGYPWVREAIILSKMNENVYIDITFLDVIDYTYEPGVMESTIKKAYQALGSSKIVWGSEGAELGLPAYEDSGIKRVKEYIANIQMLDFLSESDREKIMFQNSIELIKQSKSNTKP